MKLSLTPDELLSTTRAVRKRLDLSRPVEREVLIECLTLAQQAPQGGNREPWRFIVVTDADKRAAIAEYFRRAIEISYGVPPAAEGGDFAEVIEAKRGGQSFAQADRIFRSVAVLYENLHLVPVHVVPCVKAAPPGASARGFDAANTWGDIVPGVWSFMLAARSRGLGTVWTTVAFMFEREIAELLDIPDDYQQTALIPVAYTKGTDFKPAKRQPLERMVSWEGW